MILALATNRREMRAGARRSHPGLMLDGAVGSRTPPSAYAGLANDAPERADCEGRDCESLVAVGR
jgi:hypothetical protein